MAAISLADDPCATARQGIKALRASDAGQIVMMTRDRRTVALRIAPQLGIKPDDVDAALLPQDKVAWVDQLDKHGSAACVGDKVNDAAALARADVGIAMGAAGSEAALQAADVARMAAALSGPSAPSGTSHRLARRTLRILWQHLFCHRCHGGPGHLGDVLPSVPAAGGFGR